MSASGDSRSISGSAKGTPHEAPRNAIFTSHGQLDLKLDICLLGPRKRISNFSYLSTIQATVELPAQPVRCHMCNYNLKQLSCQSERISI